VGHFEKMEDGSNRPLIQEKNPIAGGGGALRSCQQDGANREGHIVCSLRGGTPYLTKSKRGGEREKGTSFFQGRSHCVNTS